MGKLASLFAAALVLTGCAKDIQNKDAVRQGVVRHLSERKNLDLDMSSMTVEVGAVSFREKEADATVSFYPKGGSPSSGMTMRYTLERKGDAWVVKKKAESGGGGHAAGMPAEPPPRTGADLPPNHPPIPTGPPSGARK